MTHIALSNPGLKLADVRRLHFIGIGGAGMSGIALVLHRRGFEVSGSDLKPSRYVTLLEDAGVHVALGHDPANVDQPDVVVISTAIPEHNRELAAARERGIPVVRRAQALAWVMEGRRGIAVCGTHGKTTTTSMISRALIDAERDPSFLIGGELNDFGSNARHGEGDLMVCEADESDGTLLYLRPEISVFTNLELDHHSHYQHVEDVAGVFRSFVSLLPETGRMIYWADDPRLAALAADAHCHTTSYGVSPGADYQAREVSLHHRGSRFEVWRRGHRLTSAELVVPGLHNILNAMACFAVLGGIGISPARIAASLRGFTGAARRFQWKGERAGVSVVDDYAHHPTELKATLRAARTGEWSRVIAVFQPHLYSRTRFLHHDFAQALLEADIAVVTDVYGAREEPQPGVSGKLIVDSLLRESPRFPVVYLPRLSQVVEYLGSTTRSDDLVLTMGAGDVHRVGESFLGTCSE
ncbi:MAG: UDP-N-acetylmuramate--L-alanine ligase [Actinobacteria bacterium]|nr:UDP-N-acetylmuramate--L-alanine ligase [Actinomycetota bacterium]